MAKKAVRVVPPCGRPCRLLPVGATLVCANTPAKRLQIIGVRGIQGTKRRLRSAGVGSVVIVTVKKGPEQMKHKVYLALVIRQRAPYTRFQLGKICFEDNAAIILDADARLKKGVIRGVIARQVTRSPLYAQIAGKIV